MKRTKTIEKYLSQLEDMKLEIENQVGKAQDKYDAMSERQQDNDRGQALAEDIGKLEELQASLEGLFEEMDNTFEAD